MNEYFNIVTKIYHFTLMHPSFYIKYFNDKLFYDSFLFPFLLLHVFLFNVSKKILLFIALNTTIRSKPYFIIIKIEINQTLI